ncbi:hypothetical protein SDC9_130631 [bioreactor metagenome]|uniref:Uncharacterized protein n=1 Tax=bioreactor metagenome TaxID=1076179 RepID=A0A645D327_9ZZZZ
MAFLCACVVDQNVDLIGRQDLFGDHGQRLTVGQIGLVMDESPSALNGLDDHALIGRTPGDHVHVDSGIQQCGRDTQPEPPTSSGDHGGQAGNVKS